MLGRGGLGRRLQFECEVSWACLQHGLWWEWLGGDRTEKDWDVDDEEGEVDEIALAREDAPWWGHDCFGGPCEKV